MNKQNKLLKSAYSLTSTNQRQLIIQEGKKLERIARREWEAYYQSYTPKQYIRTYKSRDALKLKTPTKRIDGGWDIELTWEDDLAYHDSRFGKKNNRGHAIMLISDGWESRKLKAKLGGKRIERLTDFDGTGYLYNVYKKYLAVADRTITTNVIWSGNYTKK